MREIKFRVWDREKGMMAEYLNLAITLNGEISELKMGEDGDNVEWLGTFYSEKKYELMQFTGLRDSTGKEIYEGDIVGICEADDMDWRIYQVKYHGDRDYPAFDIEPSIDCDCNGLSYAVACCEIEVIGNVFENPELLKGGTDDTNNIA